jgi:hypothetical protein
MEAIIYLKNGQKKYGRVLEHGENGLIKFISFLNEQLFGIESLSKNLEFIPANDIREIDFCMK